MLDRIAEVRAPEQDTAEHFLIHGDDQLGVSPGVVVTELRLLTFDDQPVGLGLDRELEAARRRSMPSVSLPAGRTPSPSRRSPTGIIWG